MRWRRIRDTGPFNPVMPPLRNSALCHRAIQKDQLRLEGDWEWQCRLVQHTFHRHAPITLALRFPNLTFTLEQLISVQVSILLVIRAKGI